MGATDLIEFAASEICLKGSEIEPKIKVAFGNLRKSSEVIDGQ